MQHKKAEPAHVQKLKAKVEQYREMLTLENHKLMREIQERGLVQAELLQKLEQQRALLDALPAGVFLKDAQLRYIAVNEHMARWLSLKPEVMIGRRDAELFPPRQAQAMERWDRWVLGQNKPLPAKTESLYLPHGGHLWVLSNRIPFQDVTGQIVGLAGSFLDITSRKTMEDRLRDSEEKFRLLTERSLAGVFIFQEGRFDYFNYELTLIFDRDPRELKLGQAAQSLIHPEDYPRFEDKINRLIRGEITSSHFQFRGLSSRGDTKYLEAYMSRMDYHEEPAVMGTLLDMTERNLSEEALRQSAAELEHLNRTLEERIAREIAERRQQEQILIHQSRLAAMGEMVGAIAHQWRQPLATLGLITRNIRSAWQNGALDQTYLSRATERVDQQLHYLSQTIDDFRNFFRADDTRGAFPLAEALEESVSISSPQLENHRIQIRMNLPETTIQVPGYPNALKQVAVSILNNAKDAIMERRQQDPLWEGWISIRAERIGRQARIEIGNNGVPIPPDQIGHVFDPYFTTKPDRGTGIGLYMSRILIEEHLGGCITVENRSAGVFFILSFPLHQENKHD